MAVDGGEERMEGVWGYLVFWGEGLDGEGEKKGKDK